MDRVFFIEITELAAYKVDESRVIAMTRQFNFEHTDFKFLPDGVEFETNGSSNFFSYSNIVNVHLFRKKQAHILLKLKNSEIPDIEFVFENDARVIENSSLKKLFISFCKNIAENTDLKISYQVYPKHIGDIVKKVYFSLIVIVVFFGIYVSFFMGTVPSRGLFLIFWMIVGLIYWYKKIEKKKFGRQIIAKDNLDELDIFLTRKIFTRKIGNILDFASRSGNTSS